MTSPTDSATTDDRRRSTLLEEEIDDGCEGPSTSYGRQDHHHNHQSQQQQHHYHHSQQQNHPHRVSSSSSSFSDHLPPLQDSVLRVVDEAHLFASLLPLLLAHLGPVAAQDARASVQVLTMIQDLLPLLSELNMRRVGVSGDDAKPGGPNNSDNSNSLDEPTTSKFFYAVAESEHPYKPAGVTFLSVKFPESVQVGRIGFPEATRWRGNLIELWKNL